MDACPELFEGKIEMYFVLEGFVIFSFSACGEREGSEVLKF